jgi:neutral amino acid transport system permease protein
MSWGLIFSNGLYAAVSANAVAYMLVATGLNIHFGNTGLLNFGQAGFAAVGAYGLAIPISRYHWNPAFAIVVVVVLAAALAIGVGLLTLRLRSDYLAIVTIALAEIIRIFVNGNKYKWLTGGSDGVQKFGVWMENLSPFSTTGFTVWEQHISGYQMWLLIVGWILLLILVTALYFLIRSPWGRVLKGIREDEDAVRSLGKNVFAFKMQSLVLGGVIGAVGGMWLVLDKGSAQPGDFATTLTFFAYTMVIIGGIARVKGPIVGAMIFLFLFTFVDSFLQQATKVTPGDPNPVLPKWLVTDNNYAQVKYILAGLLLAVLVAFRPQGIFGDKNEQAFDVR